MSPCYFRQDDQESLNGERLNHTEIWGRIVAVRGKKMCKGLGVESYLAWSDSNRETCVPGTDCAEGESRPETLHVSGQLNEFMADAREQVEGRSLVWWRLMGSDWSIQSRGVTCPDSDFRRTSRRGCSVGRRLQDGKDGNREASSVAVVVVQQWRLLWKRRDVYYLGTWFEVRINRIFWRIACGMWENKRHQKWLHDFSMEQVGACRLPKWGLRRALLGQESWSPLHDQDHVPRNDLYPSNTWHFQKQFHVSLMS